MPGIWSVIISEQAEKFWRFSRTVEDVTRSIHVTKSKGRLSDFTFTQGLVENLGLVTSAKNLVTNTYWFNLSLN